MSAAAAIANADSADLPAMQRLERLCNPTPWSATQLAESLHAPNHCWLYRRQGAVVAMLVWQALPQEAEIHLLDTDPAWRRHGFARALLQTLLTHARAAGLARVLLEVRANNAAARALYRHTGFTECGRRRGYYRDGEDAVLMEWIC